MPGEIGDNITATGGFWPLAHRGRLLKCGDEPRFAKLRPIAEIRTPRSEHPVSFQAEAGYFRVCTSGMWLPRANTELCSRQPQGKPRGAGRRRAWRRIAIR